ncbi:MAG TPA: aminotransferase class IV [Longimicrobiales bacterium]|nr:aminotransferase class IV [Longimicrobiales bacterium]
MVYLDGAFVDASDARVSVADRGFLFADGVYEVVRVYDGRMVFLEEHLERLRRGLSELTIDWDGAGGLETIARRLLAENGLERSDATLYVQVTRGAPRRRSHTFPEGVRPTVYAAAQAYPRHAAERYRDGVGALLVDDQRWKRRDIKSIALLPNVLANQRAHENGAFEALFVEGGCLLEGSHSNLFAVEDGVAITHPTTTEILPGITRAVVLGLAADVGVEVREEPIPADRLGAFSELFLTGTTTEVMPVTRVDGAPVGDGRPGPVARALQAAYLAHAGVREEDAGRTSAA